MISERATIMANKMALELMEIGPDAMTMLMYRGRDELLMANRIHLLHAMAREFLKELDKE